MLQNGRAKPGQRIRGILSWSCGGEPSGSISYDADMEDLDNARLVLSYTRGEGAEAESVRQEVRLVYTLPHYGGRRWWMVCPYRSVRCTKLFKPRNGDRFASRRAWRIAYSSQRGAWHDRPFDKLNRIQRKLGCREGYDEWIFRPKGMWHRTFARHEAQFEAIHAECDQVWVGMMARLGVISGRL